MKASIYQSLSGKGIDKSDIPVIVETVKDNSKNRELIFETIFYYSKRGLGGGATLSDNIFNNVYGLNVSAINSKIIANYIFFKYAKEGVDYTIEK